MSVTLLPKLEPPVYLVLILLQCSAPWVYEQRLVCWLDHEVVIFREQL